MVVGIENSAVVSQKRDSWPCAWLPRRVQSTVNLRSDPLLRRQIDQWYCKRSCDGGLQSSLMKHTSRRCWMGARETLICHHQCFCPRKTI